MNNSARLRLWHGGAPGRKTGDWLLSPSETGVPSVTKQMTLEELGGTNMSQRDDMVYVTTDRELARAWAGIWSPDGVTFGGGSLYQVEADELAPDGDFLSLDGFFQTPRARVKFVYDAHVPHHPKQLKQLDRVLKLHAEKKAQAESTTRRANGERDHYGGAGGLRGSDASPHVRRVGEA